MVKEERIKQMKKKLLTTVLTVGVVLSLVGCGAKETTSSGNVAETEVEEIATEEVAEETVVEATTEEVVEEQATETTETVEETVVEETTEAIEETASVPEGYPTVFANDDPRTSEVVDLQSLLGDADMRMYVWASDEAPIITMYPTTENYETVKEAVTLDIEGIESFATVSTDEGEKEVVLVTTANDDGTVSYEYVYTLGSCTIEVDDTVSHSVGTAEDLQYFVDLIKY